MASNSFGRLFRITTWGESHGSAVGVVIDGCPAGLEISEEEINSELARRAPGNGTFTSKRRESDKAGICSGLFEGKTTGAPISIIIRNEDVDSSAYESVKHLLKPGHAQYTYLEKYGVFDYRGGGRASARETACRVVAGAVAKKLLIKCGVTVSGAIREIGGEEDLDKVGEILESADRDGDSVGGVVECIARGLPGGLGNPIYGKLDALLACAMMSIPASKGFEVGNGFGAARMSGSKNNDEFVKKDGEVQTVTNNAGGVLGGISTGMPLVVRVAFKPTSSIAKEQKTIDLDGNDAVFAIGDGARHDTCVAIRAVPVVEAMMAIVLASEVIENDAFIITDGN